MSNDQVREPRVGADSRFTTAQEQKEDVDGVHAALFADSRPQVSRAESNRLFERLRSNHPEIKISDLKPDQKAKLGELENAAVNGKLDQLGKMFTELDKIRSPLKKNECDSTPAEPLLTFFKEINASAADSIKGNHNNYYKLNPDKIIGIARKFPGSETLIATTKINS